MKKSERMKGKKKRYSETIPQMKKRQGEAKEELKKRGVETEKLFYNDVTPKMRMLQLRALMKAQRITVDAKAVCF